MSKLNSTGGCSASGPRHRWPRYSIIPGFLLSCLVAAVWLTGGIAGPADSRSGDGTPFPTPPSTATNGAAAIEGIAAWLNSEPLALADLRGQVVLLDFWTYTCVNCIRTFDQLRLWHSRYADAGLVIIGIHTPEFEFEKDPANVLQATRNYGITWPVALDNDYVTWDNYQNAFWPTKYLIDGQGRVRHHRIGEGGYAATEEKLRQLLLEAGADLSDNPPTSDTEPALDDRFLAAPDREITRELYAGYERGAFELEFYGEGYVGQLEYYQQAGETLQLTAPEYLQPNLIYFQGHWSSEPQRAGHARLTTGFDDYIALVYSARSVNAVLTTEDGAEDGAPYKVRVTLDGEYLTEENRGADVIIGPDGESYLWVAESRLYRVVETPDYIQRKELRLSANSDRLGLYAFTFGIYETGP